MVGQPPADPVATFLTELRAVKGEILAAFKEGHGDHEDRLRKIEEKAAKSPTREGDCEKHSKAAEEAAKIAYRAKKLIEAHQERHATLEEAEAAEREAGATKRDKARTWAPWVFGLLVVAQTILAVLTFLRPSSAQGQKAVRMDTIPTFDPWAFLATVIGPAAALMLPAGGLASWLLAQFEGFKRVALLPPKQKHLVVLAIAGIIGAVLVLMGVIGAAPAWWQGAIAGVAGGYLVSKLHKGVQEKKEKDGTKGSRPKTGKTDVAAAYRFHVEKGPGALPTLLVAVLGGLVLSGCGASQTKIDQALVATDTCFAALAAPVRLCVETCVMPDLRDGCADRCVDQIVRGPGVPVCVEAYAAMDSPVFAARLRGVVSISLQIAALGYDLAKAIEAMRAAPTVRAEACVVPPPPPPVAPKAAPRRTR